MDIMFFGIEERDAQTAIESHIEEIFTGYEFNVMTEESREENVKENIRESLWAFRPSFIMNHLRQEAIDNMSEYDYNQVEKTLEKVTGELCESANGLILALIDDLDEFIDEVVNADGYGHFLSPYDGEEYEFEYNGDTYYIYKQN
jgi:hypothetical protein